MLQHMICLSTYTKKISGSLYISTTTTTTRRLRIDYSGSSIVHRRMWVILTPFCIAHQVSTDRWYLNWKSWLTNQCSLSTLLFTCNWNACNYLYFNWNRASLTSSSSSSIAFRVRIDRLYAHCLKSYDLSHLLYLCSMIQYLVCMLLHCSQPAKNTHHRKRYGGTKSQTNEITGQPSSQLNWFRLSFIFWLMISLFNFCPRAIAAAIYLIVFLLFKNEAKGMLWII